MISRLFTSFFRKPPENKELHFSVPILCYHSWTVGDCYQNDDHIALEKDLEFLYRHNYKILPIMSLVEILRGELCPSLIKDEKFVCISFDDGFRYDYEDAKRPDGSVIKSFRGLLREYKDKLPLLHKGSRAVSFVIASAEARRSIWSEFPEKLSDHDWWSQCFDEDLIAIANHSWDHVHEKVKIVRQKDNIKGNFFSIDNAEDAKAQIDDAQDLILNTLDEDKGHHLLPIFGYPYGHDPSYLKDEYLPANCDRLKLQAAFTTAGDYVRPGCNIWSIPRFVCGYHWRSVEQLQLLLEGNPVDPTISTTPSSQGDKGAEADSYKQEINTEEPSENHIKSHGNPDLETEIKLEDVFTVVEVDKAEFIVGDLFRRRFNIDSFPDFPKHFVAFIKLPSGNTISAGYVHQTPWKDCFLTGGLVTENQPAEEIPESTLEVIWRHGGIARLLLQHSIKSFPQETKAVWAHVGHARSQVVCEEVGFRRTTDQYVMENWLDDTVSAAERQSYLKEVVALGPF